MNEYDYGPDVEAMHAQFLRDSGAQESLARFMTELEHARRQLAHIKAQKKSNRTEIRYSEKTIAGLENDIRAVFVNYALVEAPLKDGSVIIDEAAAQGGRGFRPIRRRA
ncbi:MAG: hypothetical protein K2Z80_25665 [Xanthobacteraceae bacterium]|nr:hypothetical protein [Xanthobacteraceae bacterium]